jgi:hypothetical protein
VDGHADVRSVDVHVTAPTDDQHEHDGARDHDRVAHDDDYDRGACAAAVDS